MKKIFLLLTILCTVTIFAVAEENEKQKPLLDTEVERKIAVADIEGEIYNDVTIKLVSSNPTVGNNFKRNVRVVVRDSEGKKVYAKTLNNCGLYVFTTGQIQVAYGGFLRLFIDKDIETGLWMAKLRDKEGVY